MQAEEARRYSRRVGLSSCESVNGTPGRCFLQQLADALLMSRVDDRPQQADRDRLHFRGLQGRNHAASMPLHRMAPLRPVGLQARSGTSQVSDRGMYGSGNGTVKLNGSARPPSRSTSTSGWPSVVRNAVRAVLPVMIALIACVVP